MTGHSDTATGRSGGDAPTGESRRKRRIHPVFPGLLAAALAYGLLLPIPVRLVQRFPASLELEDVEAHDLESAVPTGDGFWRRSTEAMRAEGFVRIGAFEQSNPSPGQRLHLLFFVNEANGDAGAVAVFSRTGENGLLPQSRHIAFHTRYADGSSLETNNNDELSVMPLPENVRVASFSGTPDPRRLYGVHRALCARNRGETLASDPHNGARIAQDGWRTVMDEGVRRGYLEASDAPDALRLTWKGTYLMTWKLIPPASSIRRMLQRHREAATIRDLGL